MQNRNSPAAAAAAAAALVLGAVATPALPAAASWGPTNPFFAPSPLPFQAPPFDKIKDQDYQPAIERGMAQELAEVRRIAATSAAPTFENTLVALERGGRLLERARAAFNCVVQADTNPVLQRAKTELAPKLAAHHDAIYLDERLFARVDSLYRRRAALGLDPESRRLLQVVHDEFVRSGAELPAAKRARLRELNERLSTLSAAFSSKLLAATKDGALITESRDALAGLSEAQLGAAPAAAGERGRQGYLVPLQNTTQQPLLGSMSVRATRQALYENSWNRAERGGDDDTRETLAHIAQLRAERAALLGFPSHAAWKIADQMAKTPEAALAFMDRLVPVAVARAAGEARQIQAVIDAGNGGFQLAPWDWDFYAEQVRRAKYDLEDAAVKPYFELDNVLRNGLFYAAERLYGITFVERRDLPVYHPDVRVFEVRDVDGKPLALFYCDYFKRDNKSGGAWMSNLAGQSSLLGTRPVVYNVANLPKPAPGEPALITFTDVTTMFHEFGHALHGMFAATRYPSLSGTATARDFVEFPSQFNEHWALYPSVFEHYARHHRTGEPMPADLVEKIKRAANFNEGYKLTELLAAAELDLQWHTLPAGAPLEDPDAFERRSLERVHLDLPAVPPRYRSSYFSHIWASGYSAGYYAYLWTEMLADDAYGWFDDHGGLTRANGDRLRAMILARGNTEDLAAMYAAWRGRPPTIDAMMHYRGLAAAP